MAGYGHRLDALGDSASGVPHAFGLRSTTHESSARMTSYERRASLPTAERLLERAASAERESLHWSNHLLDLVWAAGSSAYILRRSWHHEDLRLRPTCVALSLLF